MQSLSRRDLIEYALADAVSFLIDEKNQRTTTKYEAAMTLDGSDVPVTFTEFQFGLRLSVWEGHPLYCWNERWSDSTCPVQDGDVKGPAEKWLANKSRRREALLKIINEEESKK